MDDDFLNSDFDKQTNNLKDTQLQYHLFIKNNQDIDEIHEKLNISIKRLTQNYTWNNEMFCLSKKNPKIIDNFYVYEDIIDFGENIEDEWFIVYLIIELTKEFYKYKLIAQIYDSDNDFILIYLANYLPEWASSAANNCMKNRVYIYDGKLHLIKPATNPSQITYLPASGYLNLSQTQIINCILDFEYLTCANNELQTSLAKRVSIFKKFEKLLLHQTTCKIPAKLAWYLSKTSNEKSILCKAVNRFCDKDPKDLKLCRVLEKFKIDEHKNPIIDYRVTFTKYTYSKIKCTDYKPDRRHEWPLLNDTKLNETERERLLLGLKLTCSFELLAKLDSELFMDFFEHIPENYLDLLIHDIEKQKTQNDDSDDWLHVDQTHLDDYLDAYSHGDVHSTYDFEVLSNAFKKFFNKNNNLDYNPINKDNNSVNFNINSIEDSLNEILMKRKVDVNSDDSDEADSFYEVDENDVDDDEDQNLKEYIKSMDKELEGEKNLSRIGNVYDEDDDDEENLNVDLNLVSNAIESYSSQLGLSGPVSNILKSLGI